MNVSEAKVFLQRALGGAGEMLLGQIITPKESLDEERACELAPRTGE
jgi:hypothetical protein